jgi:8-oxo-dGTP pyrophosphatase MutT (NUDIX family)
MVGGVMDVDRGKVEFQEEVFNLNPWVDLVKRYIPDEIEPYVHFLAQDYVTVIAINNARIALVRQFRIALDIDTIELPSGLIEPGQSPLQAAIKELGEEVGLIPSSEPFVFPVQYVDSARLSNRVHAFFFDKTDEDPNWIPERGISRHWVNKDEIQGVLESGVLTISSHSGMLAILKTLEVI